MKFTINSIAMFDIKSGIYLHDSTHNNIIPNTKKTLVKAF